MYRNPHVYTAEQMRRKIARARARAFRRYADANLFRIHDEEGYRPYLTEYLYEYEYRCEENKLVLFMFDEGHPHTSPYLRLECDGSYADIRRKLSEGMQKIDFAVY